MPPKFQCEQCDRSFDTNVKRNTHARNFHKETTHICTQCGEAFNHAWILTRHETKHKDKADQQRFYCDAEGCQISCTRKSGLQKHKRRFHHSKNAPSQAESSSSLSKQPVEDDETTSEDDADSQVQDDDAAAAAVALMAMSTGKGKGKAKTT